MKSWFIEKKDTAKTLFSRNYHVAHCTVRDVEPESWSSDAVGDISWRNGWVKEKLNTLLLFCANSEGIQYAKVSDYTFIQARRTVFRYLTEVIKQPNSLKNKQMRSNTHLQDLAKELSN